MASKLNTSLPVKRGVGPPPDRLREWHDEQRHSRITNERQFLKPSPLARHAQTFITNCDPPMPIPDPLFGPGRGKAAGSTRKLRRGIRGSND